MEEVCGESNAGHVSDAVEIALRALPMLQGKFLRAVPVLDTNWISTPYVGFGMRVYDRKLNRVFSKGTDDILSNKWSPSKVDRLTHFRFRDNTDDFARVYF